MKKTVSLLLALCTAFLLTACVDVVRPSTKSESAFEQRTQTTAPAETLHSADTSTVPDTTAIADTADVTDTTASETLREGEKIVYGEDGEQYIEGSQVLFGDGADTTAPIWDTEEPEEQKYPTVLMYHCIHDEPYTENTALFVRPSELDAHCKVIKEMELETLFADEFGPCEKDSVILTFDDGYEDNYTYMFPIIKKYNIKVTVYMIAYKIDKPGYLTSEQMKEMSDSGLVQFGSHTLDHPSLVSLDEDGIRQQMEGSAWLISNVTGKSVTTIAYPGGDYNSTVMDVASTIYKFAYTTDADPYLGQSPMMLPRYAILRGMGADQFRVFVE